MKKTKSTAKGARPLCIADTSAAMLYVLLPLFSVLDEAEAMINIIKAIVIRATMILKFFEQKDIIE